ncbi:MAG TPA: hypothetical protein VGA04_33485 [Streptosporangiaceae bacterium]
MKAGGLEAPAIRHGLREGFAERLVVLLVDGLRPDAHPHHDPTPPGGSATADPVTVRNSTGICRKVGPIHR